MEDHGDPQILALSNVSYVILSNIEQARATEKRRHKKMSAMWYLLTISIQQKMGPASWSIWMPLVAMCLLSREWCLKLMQKPRCILILKALSFKSVFNYCILKLTKKIKSSFLKDSILVTTLHSSELVILEIKLISSGEDL